MGVAAVTAPGPGQARWQRASRAWGGVLLAVFVAGGLLLLVAAADPGVVARLPWPLELFADSTAWPVLTVQIGLGAATWLAYHLPRRRERRPFSLIMVISLGATAVPLGLTAYWNCSGDQASGWTPVYRTMALFVGSVEMPFGQVEGCPAAAPLALQLARLAALTAVAVGAGSALLLLFRNQLDRLQVRWARSLVVVAGVGPDTLPVLTWLRSANPPATRIVVLNPRPGQDVRRKVPGVIVVDEADDAAGWPIGRRRGALPLRALYALHPDATRNVAVFDALRPLAATASSRRLSPRAVIRIDDPWQAEHWRRAHVTVEPDWIVDAVGSHEVTARVLLDRWVADGLDRVVLVGHSLLALAVCNEFAQRRREAASSRWPGAELRLGLVAAGEDSPVLRAQHMLAQRRFGNFHEQLQVDERPSTAELLAALLDGASRPAVAFLAPAAAGAGRTELPSPSLLAVTYPEWTLFEHSEQAGPLDAKPIMERLHPFGLSWQSNSHWGLDRWERAARIAHTNFLYDHRAEPSWQSRRAWDDGLSDFHKETNIRLITTALASAVTAGRNWGPFEPGDDEPDRPTPAQLDLMVRLEHESWMAHHLAAGWKYSAVRDDTKRRHDRLLPWESLDEENQNKTRGSVRDAIELLRGLGYRSKDVSMPPPDWQTYHRKGRVRAVRTDRPVEWTTDNGSVLQAEAGDWIVSDDTGSRWSVKPPEFAASYRALGGDAWERVGVVRAYRTDVDREIDTLEGTARARPGDWILHGVSGEYWVVSHPHFTTAYETPPL